MTTTVSSKGTALVTGAAQGIGRAIALRLATDGFDVALNDIHSQSEALQAVASEVVQKGRRTTVVTGDVSREADVQQLVEGVVESLGGLDVMVANAGIGLTKLIADTTTEDWDRLFSVNARGTFLCYKYAAEQMVKQGRGGRIVGACSIAGKKGFADASAYCASKFAVRGLTQSAAQEYGKHSITVNAYAPGAIETTFLDKFDEYFTQRDGLKRGSHTEDLKSFAALRTNGTPEDVAGVVSYLVSSEAHFVTGQSIIVDGGVLFD